MTESVIGFAAVFLLVLLRIPIAIALGIVGLVGLYYGMGWVPARTLVGMVT